MKHLLLLGSLLCLLGCQQTVRPDALSNAQDWPLFRGDAALRGYADISLPEKPTLVWSYPSGQRTASSPVVYAQTAFWSDKRGRIYGLDAEGKLCFDYDMATAVEATPMIQDSVLYVGRIDGMMVAISLALQDTLWTYETDGQISASANVGLFEGSQAVVFGSYDNYLYCLNTANGKLLHRFESGYYINGAVALWQNHFISGGCDAWLRIIDGTAGVATDSLLLDTYIPASPAIDGDECYIADHSGNIYKLLLHAGHIVQSEKVITATDDSGSFVSVPALSAETVFILSDDRHLYAIDRASGAIRWRFLQKGNSGESSPLGCRDKSIICSRSGIISLLKASDGKLLWEYDAGEQITANPAAISNRLYILTTKGTLLCFG